MSALASRLLVKIGEGGIIQAPDRMETVLGSCVGVVLVNRSARVFGLAHVVLPRPPEGPPVRQPSRFASTAPGWLLDNIGPYENVRKDVRAVLVGGSQMYDSTSHEVGQANAAVVRAQLRALGVRVVKTHLGGSIGRKIIVDADEGSVAVLMLEGGASVEEERWKLVH